eukprot:gene10122-biopygen18266
MSHVSSFTNALSVSTPTQPGSYRDPGRGEERKKKPGPRKRASRLLEAARSVDIPGEGPGRVPDAPRTEWNKLAHPGRVADTPSIVSPRGPGNDLPSRVPERSSLLSRDRGRGRLQGPGRARPAS